MKSRLLSTARLPFTFAAAIAAMISHSATSTASATPYYWDTDGITSGAGGASPGGGWTSAGLTWSADSTGASATSAYTTLNTDDLTFSAGSDATGAYTVSLTTTQNARSLTFEEGTATISGTGGIITLGGTGDVTVNSGASAVIGNGTTAKIGGTAGLTKLGAGTLTLNGSTVNNFTGTMAVNAGTLALSPTGAITMSNTVTGTGILNINPAAVAAANLALTGNLSGFSGTINVATSGGFSSKFTTTGASSTLGAGTVVNVASGGSWYNTVGQNNITVNLSSMGNSEVYGALRVDSGSTIGSGASVVLKANSAIGTNGIGTVDAVISENGGSYTLTKSSGPGTIVLTNANTYTGGTSIVGGTLRFAKINSMPATGTVAAATGATLAVNAGGTDEFTNATSGAGSIGGLLALTGGLGAPVTYTGTTALGIDTTNASGGSLTYSGVIANAGTALGITKLGTGALVLDQVNTFQGATIIRDGTLDLNNSLALQNSALDTGASIAGTATVGLRTNATTLTLGGLSGTTPKNLAALFRTDATGGPGGTTALGGYSGVTALTLNPGTGQTPGYSAIIADGATGMTLTKTGAGTQTLSGANSYTGGTTISAGVLNAGAAGALGSGSVANNATLNLTPTVATAYTFGAVSGGGIVNISLGAGSATASFTNATWTGLTAGSVINIGVSQASGAGKVTLTKPIPSTATVNITANSTLYTGFSAGYTIDAALTLAGGNIGEAFGQIRMDNSMVFTGPVTLTGDITGTNRATVSIGGTLTSTFSGAIGETGGPRNFSKGGTGTVILGNTNTYTGATIINAGALTLGVANTLADSSNVVIGNGKLNVAASVTDTVGTLKATGAASIDLGAGAALAFADSSAEDWTGGTLAITGTFVSGSSLKFGNSTTSLTIGQLASITATGFTNFALNSSGFLTATSTAGYAAWQSANSTAGALDQDHDNDGVSNGVEYFLGGNTLTTGFTTLPGVIDNGGTRSITWTKAASGYSGSYGTDFVLETSDTLDTGSWTTVATNVNPDIPNTVYLNGGNVTYTFPAPGTKKFVRLKVTGP